MGTAKEFTFEAAQSIRREFAGFSDWRLPTLDELKSIVDASRTGPTIDTDIFYGCESTGPLFWTSTVDDGLWYVSFYSGTGYSANRDARDLVRLVRSISPQRTQISESNSDRPPEDISLNTERQNTNIDYLLRDIERSEQPSINFINAVLKSPSIVTCRGGKFSRTLLHHAAALGKIHIVKHLCSLSLVDVNCVDIDGDTPLDYALRSQNSKSFEVVNFLRSKGAQTKIERNSRLIFEKKYKEEKIPLITESVKQMLREALTLTVSRECLFNFVLNNPHLINEKLFDQSKTMLDLAIQAGNPKVVSWLISKGANVRTENVSGSSPETSAGLQRAAVQEFPLDLRNAGSGAGTVSIAPDLQTYPVGSQVKLTAHAAEDSIFTHWSGDLSGLDSACNLTVDAAKHVIANFESLDIPDFSLSVAIDALKQATMQSNDEAFIVYLSITNKGAKQIRIELPFASYVTCRGEEFEQDAWLIGLVNGGNGASIRAGNFRKAGLVFYKSKLASISTGDCLHITILQAKPSQRFNFSFRCTNQASSTFVLVKAELEEMTLQPKPDSVEVFHEKSVILQRLYLLQSGLDEVLRRLERLEASPVAVAPHAPFEQEATTSTRTQVLAWLASQQRVSVAALRHRLLPLDLLPSAFIDEVNERALDFVGEPALEDQNDEVAVIQDVLAVVLAIWEGDSV